jgi:hypothetical protein
MRLAPIGRHMTACQGSASGGPYSSISRNSFSKSAISSLIRCAVSGFVAICRASLRYLRIFISNSTRSFFDRAAGIPSTFFIKTLEWPICSTSGAYRGDCSPGDESQSLIWDNVSSCRIFLRSASIWGPGFCSTKRSSEWVPVKPKYVVEVSYDHFTGGRFRHGTSIIRWRPDKRPSQCTMDQVKQKVARRLIRDILAET